MLPRTYDANALRSAVGVSPLPDPSKHGASSAENRDDDEDSEPHRRPRNRKLIAVLALTIVTGLAVAALAFLGSMNSERYLLACEAERAVPQQGRGFPPWGTRPLEGEPWKPLKIAPETRCQPHETEDVLTLQRRFLAMILDQVTTLLTAREVTKIDDAEALLKQALLLTRPPAHESEALGNERNERRKEVERLLGDVTYWRASARLRDAATALSDAARQFESAAAQHPRHVDDAAAWATYARKLAQDLLDGPAGAPSPATARAAMPASAAPTAAAPSAAAAPAPAGTGSGSPSAPAGVALPIESSGSASSPAAPPDAGVPTGGVLL